MDVFVDAEALRVVREVAMQSLTRDVLAFPDAVGRLVHREVRVLVGAEQVIGL